MSAFIQAAQSLFGDTVNNIRREDIKTVVESVPGMKYPWWLEKNAEFRAGRGMYSLAKVQAYGIGGAATYTLTAPAAPKKVASTMPKIRKASVFKPSVPAPAPTVETSAAQMPVLSMSDSDSIASEAERFEHASLVPAPAQGYVPFGHFNTVQSIIASGVFYPAFVTGLSGNGKTMMIEQVCANLGREFIRVNVTAETDEDDLIGGFRLQDGKTVWQNGPVIVAMERGAILLLDEVDLGTNKLMCLQPVLEGKPVYLKKINKVVAPARGFNVLATANTKGQGSFDGKFIGTNVLNEAFLERFPVTFEQEYPAIKTEVRILESALSFDLAERGITLDPFHASKAEEFITKLVGWADGIRKLYAEGGITEIISTRRLVHIVKAFVIFNFNRRMAIELCLNRFDTDTKIQFVDLYSKIDTELDGIASPQPSVSSSTTEERVETASSPSNETISSVAPTASTQPVPAAGNVTPDTTSYTEAVTRFADAIASHSASAPATDSKSEVLEELKKLIGANLGAMTTR
jgi:hypothetical protein